MLRMIIADDERIIRESLLSLTNWADLGIEIVNCCKNGIEVLDSIIDDSPDIILTDIKMPGFSGLELIEKIQQTDPEIEFIILSGYKEFEFAKQAMKFGVKHYLLKPICEAQIIAAVEQVKNSCIQRHSVKNLLEGQKKLQEEMTAFYQKQFLFEIFSKQEKSVVSLSSSYLPYFLFPECTYQLCYFLGLSEQVLLSFSQEWMNFINKPGINPIFPLLYVKNLGIAMLTIPNHQKPELSQKFFSSLPSLCQKMNIAFQAEIFSDPQSCLNQITRDLSQYSKVLLLNKNLEASEIYNSTIIERIDHISKELCSYSQKGTLTEAEICLEHFWDSIPNINQTKSLGAYLLLSLYELTGKEKNVLGIFDSIYRELNILRLQEELTQTILELLFPTITQTSRLVDKMMKYVQDNLSDPRLSLKWLAENYFFMNSNYLSRLFVSQTHEKFSSYLNRLRMERAKELLLKYDVDKIYRVAELIGFGNNPRYFSQMFKKYTGLTPSEYVGTDKS